MFRYFILALLFPAISFAQDPFVPGNYRGTLRLTHITFDCPTSECPDQIPARFRLEKRNNRYFMVLRTGRIGMQKKKWGLIGFASPLNVDLGDLGVCTFYPSFSLKPSRNSYLLLEAANLIACSDGSAVHLVYSGYVRR
jgi:hypothetical protein